MTDLVGPSDSVTAADLYQGTQQPPAISHNVVGLGALLEEFRRQDRLPTGLKIIVTDGEPYDRDVVQDAFLNLRATE
jgi:hypothetical protein